MMLRKVRARIRLQGLAGAQVSARTNLESRRIKRAINGGMRDGFRERKAKRGFFSCEIFCFLKCDPFLFSTYISNNHKNHNKSLLSAFPLETSKGAGVYKNTHLHMIKFKIVMLLISPVVLEKGKDSVV